MKKTSVLLLFVFLLIFALITGCQENPTPESSSPSPVASPDMPVSSVPDATAEMFGLSPMDTALFEGALTQDVPYSSGAGVTLPSVGIYDQYEQDGKLNVICFISYQRYDADANTMTLTSAGTSNTYGRAILIEKDGTYTCDSFDLVGEDALTEKDLREFCGDQLVELPDKIINGSAECVSSFPSNMLSLYCQSTGVSVR